LVTNLGLLGAAGAIIYNNVPGEGVLQGTMGSVNPNQIVTIGVSYEKGKIWAGALAKNLTLTASFFINSFVKNVNTFTLIAETAYDDANNIVMLGAHSDSVSAGSGIISLIQVALALSNFNVTNKVRFAWWAGEEEGLLGSGYYVSQLTLTENSQIRLFMDYDMMASRNYAYQVYNASDDINHVGSAALKQLYIDFYTANNVNYTLIPFDGRSDYDGFIKNGIAGGGVATGVEGIKMPEEALLFGSIAGQAYDPCYRQLCDDTSNLNFKAWVLNTKLIAHSVATYAASLKGFPLRESFLMTLAKNKINQTPFHGPKHVL
jgi:aminopeptidase Y